MKNENIRERSIYRSVCDVDNAITDLSSIMKRFIQTGDTPACNNQIDVYQYGNEDSEIDAQRIANGESLVSVNNSPTDSFATLSDEEMNLIPDAPTRYLEIDENGEYLEQSYSANEKARNYYRAKEREMAGKSLMAKQSAVANAIRTAEELGYKKGENDAK